MRKLLVTAWEDQGLLGKVAVGGWDNPAAGTEEPWSSVNKPERILCVDSTLSVGLLPEVSKTFLFSKLSNR